MLSFLFMLFFFFNDTATTEIYTLSLHDALPISATRARRYRTTSGPYRPGRPTGSPQDRKSTRLNSSHVEISYAVFCLKKKKTRKQTPPRTTTTKHRRNNRNSVRLHRHRLHGKTV